MSLRDGMISACVPYMHHYQAEEAVDAILAKLRPTPLVFEERRNNYWGHKSHGYQVAWNNGSLWRVRLNGRVICKEIKGHPAAVEWANNHHIAAWRKAGGLDT